MKTILVAVALLVCVSATRASAQLLYQGGGTGRIEYAVEPEVNTTSQTPIWSVDTFTEAALQQTSLNDFLENPGGGQFKSVGYGTYPNLVNTPSITPLGGGLFLPASPQTSHGLSFGGGNTAITQNSLISYLYSTTAGSYTLVNACQPSKYIVGPAGAGATIGTYLSDYGNFSTQGTFGVSLVTYINDTTTGQSAVLCDMLAAGGTSVGTGSPVVALSGETLNPVLANGNFLNPVANPNAWIVLSNGGTTYQGFSSAIVPDFLNVGDSVTMTTAYAGWTDPDLDSTINSDSPPPELLGAALPSTVLFGTAPTPEPSTLSGLGLIMLGLTTGRKTRRKSCETARR
jgi:hypothetical protein